MLGRTALRMVVGGLFAGHGAQKLFGKFGGHGLEGTGQGFEKMGLKPGVPMAAVAGGAELVGGGLVALGLFTPLGTAMLSGVMASAIERVHLRNGPWNSEGGYEYNLVLLSVLAYLADEGPGPVSLDRLRGSQRHGSLWAIAQLGAGVAGAMAVRALAERSQYAPPSQPAGSSPSTGEDERATEAGARPVGSETGSNGSTGPATSTEHSIGSQSH